MNRIPESELILNADGSIFHLHLLPGDIADNIILVGDQDRVAVISKYFDKVEIKKKNREFVTHTGYYKGKRLSVISTGIGTDNVDIVVNELDAITNIDLNLRQEKEIKKVLTFVRIGTSGALQPDIPVDTPLVTKYAIGFDGMLNFYAQRNSVSDLDMENAFKEHVGWNKLLASPYIVKSSDSVFEQMSKDFRSGLTISANGFYGPQGRILRLPIVDFDLNEKISRFEYNGMKITNYEMESSAIYGLSALLGHQALTVCNIIANRIRKEYSKDYKKSLKVLIENVLDRIADS